MATHVATVASDPNEVALADSGKRRIEWAFQSMPVLRSIRKQFIKTQPFAGIRLAACPPLTAQSANLIITLRDGGAEPVICTSDLQEDVAASLSRDFHVATATDHDLPLIVHPTSIVSGPTGICTPVRYASGQTILAGIQRAADFLFAGATVVISGYGLAGRDLAARARGLGAAVIVTEIDPVRALEAALEGFRVMALAEAAAIGDLFVSVTGNKNVIGRDHIEKLKSGAILCNGGIEIDTAALARMCSKRESRDNVDDYTMRDGRKIFVVTSAATPSAAAFDLHCATQALAAEYLLKNCESLEPKLHPVPQVIAAQVARLKLETIGAHLDRLTTEQEEYLASRDTVK